MVLPKVVRKSEQLPLVPHKASEKSVVYVGDACKVLQSLPSDSCQVAVTSPPYWGLRDYDLDLQIGSEDVLGEYVDRLVAVFSQLKRVLRSDGTLWLNLGDS